MSSTRTLADPEQATNQQPELAALRAELDRIDDAIHDLLMERARVVEQVGAMVAQGKVPLRPGREAAIIRRLLARHHGHLPRRVLPRLWRELFAGTTAMQASYVIAVCQADPAAGFIAGAREQFGALTPLRVHRTPAQAIGEVSAGHAIAAVLPMPQEDEAAGSAWWTALLHHDEPRIHVIGRLPFWTARTEGAPGVQALVVAAAAADPSGDDRSLIGLELPEDVSRARLAAALGAVGFVPGATILRRPAGAPAAFALVDVAGFVADGDPRLAAIPDVLRPPVVLGAYAVPVDGDN